MHLSQEKVQEWVAEFMKTTSGGGGGKPTDWKKLQDLMSKRVTVRDEREPLHMGDKCVFEYKMEGQRGPCP